MRQRSLDTWTIAAPVLRHVVLGLGAVVMLTPFVLMISISLKAPGDVFAPSFSLLPETWHAVENYTTAFTKQPLARYLLNGLFIGFCIFAAQALIAVPCAYALAKLRWRGRELTFAFVLLGLLIPPQVTAIPLYILLWKCGLLDTYAAIILPLDHLGIRHLPDAAVFSHGSRRPPARGPPRRPERVRDRLAHHASDRDPGARIVRHSVVRVELERVLGR